MLKAFQKLTVLLFLSTPFVVFGAEGELSAKQLLDEMAKAKQSHNYEFVFVQANPTDIDTLRYRHLNLEGRTYAQLTALDGVKREIIQRDNLISYFQVNYPPFTINSSHITDSLPGIMFSDFDRLTRYYDFINIGRNRVADRVVQTIRVIPKDNFRYQYVVFIDEENHLLLRSDMIDRDNNLLEQFRVVSFSGSDGLYRLAENLNRIHLPPLLTDQNEIKGRALSWDASWLPQGFETVKESIDTEEESADLIESRLYSDGLFSFTIYVSDRILPQEQENLWKQGVNTIYSENLGNREITLIGQIPVSTAKRIVQDIKFKQSR